MTVLTLFDSDRARGAGSSDAVRVACCACSALHAPRRLHGAQRPWGGEKALDGVHGSRGEDDSNTFCYEQGADRRLKRRPSRCVRSVCSSVRAALSTRRAAPLERLDGEKMT